jgi:urease accessory protein
MKSRTVLIFASLAALAALAPSAAFAHVDVGSVSSFAAGLDHPVSGFDHIAAMVAVGLWAALKGGRALWVWPAAFVGVMLVGGWLGMAQVPLPFVEQGILASVVVLGVLVALAVDLPVAAGAAIIGLFALLHGHAHGSEVAGDIGGVEYMLGFALATAGLHAVGLATGIMLSSIRMRPLVRAAGAACVVLGFALITGVL